MLAFTAVVTESFKNFIFQNSHKNKLFEHCHTRYATHHRVHWHHFLLFSPDTRNSYVVLVASTMGAAKDLLASVGLLASDGSVPEPALDVDTLVRAAVLFVLACLLYGLPAFLHRIKLTVQAVLYL